MVVGVVSREPTSHIQKMVADQYEARKKPEKSPRERAKKAHISSTLHHLFTKTSSRFLLYRWWPISMRPEKSPRERAKKGPHFLNSPPFVQQNLQPFSSL
jgi:hypothetical protein